MRPIRIALTILAWSTVASAEDIGPVFDAYGSRDRDILLEEVAHDILGGNYQIMKRERLVVTEDMLFRWPQSPCYQIIPSENGEDDEIINAFRASVADLRQSIGLIMDACNSHGPELAAGRISLVLDDEYPQRVGSTTVATLDAAKKSSPRSAYSVEPVQTLASNRECYWAGYGDRGQIGAGVIIVTRNGQDALRAECVRLGLHFILGLQSNNSQQLGGYRLMPEADRKRKIALDLISLYVLYRLELDPFVPQAIPEYAFRQTLWSILSEAATRP